MAFQDHNADTSQKNTEEAQRSRAEKTFQEDLTLVHVTWKEERTHCLLADQCDHADDKLLLGLKK